MHKPVLAAISVLLSVPSISFGCTCIGPTSYQAVAGATRIFAVRIDTADPPGMRSLSRYDATVLASWRGDMSESTVLYSRPGSECGFPFEIGKEYLIFLGEKSALTMEVSACTGTTGFEGAYTARYLLGAPEVLYDTDLEIVTLDTLFDLFNRYGEGDIWHCWRFQIAGIPPDMVLPRLTSIARGEQDGSRLAAVEAIARYGAAVASSVPLFKSIWDDRDLDVRLRTRSLYAMCFVMRNFTVVRGDVMRAIRDSDPRIRVGGLDALSLFSDQQLGLYSGAMRQERVRCLSDPDPDVRSRAIQTFCWRKVTGVIEADIRKMAVRDVDPDVRSIASECLDDMKRRAANQSYRNKTRR